MNKKTGFLTLKMKDDLTRSPLAGNSNKKERVVELQGKTLFKNHSHGSPTPSGILTAFNFYFTFKKTNKQGFVFLACEIEFVLHQLPIKDLEQVLHPPEQALPIEMMPATLRIVPRIKGQDG